MTAGWLSCGNPRPHPEHTWVYTDTATGLDTPAWCDGEIRAEEETP